MTAILMTIAKRESVHTFGEILLDRNVCALLQGDVLFVRFYDTPDSAMDRRTPLPSDENERLRLALAACVDVPIIMNSLPNAIRDAVKQSRA